jgi:hypothetical protein
VKRTFPASALRLGLDGFNWSVKVQIPVEVAAAVAASDSTTVMICVPRTQHERRFDAVRKLISPEILSDFEINQVLAEIPKADLETE